VICPALSATSLNVTTLDRDDSVAVSAPVPSTLDGGTGHDMLLGGPLGDTLTGGDGSDWLDGGTGADVMNGGLSTDYATYATRTLPVTVDLDDVADDGELLEGDNVGSDIEILLGGGGDDTLTGDADENAFDGGPGADTMNGGDDRDYAFYWTRTADVSVDLDGIADDGEPGENDVIGPDVEGALGGLGNDTLVGNDGPNDLLGMGGDDSITGRAGADNMSGGEGRDTVSYSHRTAPVNVTLDVVNDDGEAGELDRVFDDVEDVIAGSGADTLTGDIDANRLVGGLGSDVLTGNSGDDVFEARDLLADDVACGDGADTVTGDTLDTTAADCETLDLVAPPVEPEPEPEPQPEPEPEPEPEVEVAEAVATMTSVGKTVAMGRDGSVPVLVSCPELAAGPCEGSITLRLLPTRRPSPRNDTVAASRRRKRDKNFLGRADFSVQPGGTVKVKVKLARNGRRRVLRKRRVRCSIHVQTVAADGTRTVTKGKLTLKPPKLGRAAR
jgi:hypothetical protein